MNQTTTTQKARWFSDEAKYTELRNILALPVLVEAMQLTTNAGYPKLIGAELAPSERIHALAIEHARTAGWNEALQYLSKLATPPVSSPSPDRKSWSHKTKKALPDQ